MFEEVIGKGAQATVYKGRHKQKRNFVAIKEVSLSSFSENAIKQVKVATDLYCDVVVRG